MLNLKDLLLDRYLWQLILIYVARPIRHLFKYHMTWHYAFEFLHMFQYAFIIISSHCLLHWNRINIADKDDPSTCRPTKIQSPTTKRMFRTLVFEETSLLCRSYALDTALEAGDNNFEWQTLHSTILFCMHVPTSPHNNTVFKTNEIELRQEQHSSMKFCKKKNRIQLK